MLFAESFKASRGEPFDADAIVSINPKIAELSRLVAELAQATMSQNNAGKLLIDKIGDGERSPNLADTVVIAFAPRQMPLKISVEVLEMVSRRVARRPQYPTSAR
jgi:phage terminase large subunit